MNEYGHLALTGLAALACTFAKYAVSGLDKRISRMEEQQDEQAWHITGAELEIAALKERTKRL